MTVAPGGVVLGFAGGLLAALGMWGCAGPAPSPHQTALPGSAPPVADLACPGGFPTVGKWMYGADGEPAHWLGEVYRGRRLREPINVLILDDRAASAEDAKVRLVAACASAGYPARRGHSSDYLAFMGTGYFRQLPEEENCAFSDHGFEVDNNHGRVFGPVPLASGGGSAGGGVYCFTGAFSRENVDPVARVRHTYASFNRGRDEFTRSMDEHTQYRIVSFVVLDNAVVGAPDFTTGDHDGVAVVLSATR